MLPFQWVLAVLLAQPCLSIEAQTTTEPSISKTIPNCASACVEEYIQSDYQGACPRGGIDCLCGTNTTSGYTLGEAALRCALSYCPQDVKLYGKVYEICDEVPGALPNTHPTITATRMSIVTPTASAAQTETTWTSYSSTTETLTSETQSVTSETTSAIVTNFEPPLSLTRTTSATSTSSASSTSSEEAATSSTAAAAPAVSSEASHPLNAGAVIGVSVVSGAAGFFIIGVVIFFCFRKLKRKREQSNDRNYFEIGGVMSEPPNFGGPRRLPSPRPTPPPHDWERHPQTPRLMSPFEPRPQPQPPPVIVTGPADDRYDDRYAYERPEHIGFAISSDSLLDSRSQSSHRTVSDLLPDKPTYGLYPEPLRWSRHKYRPSHNAGGYDGTDDPFTGPSTRYTNFSSFTGHANRTRLYNPMRTGLPANPRALLYGFDETQRFLPAKNHQTDQRPVYINSEEDSQSHTPTPGNRSNRSSRRSFDQDYIGDYWQDPNFGCSRPAGRPSSRASSRNARRSYNGSNRHSDSSDTSFESDVPETLVPGVNRHSGHLKPLTPLPEVRTPSGGSRREQDARSPVQYHLPRSLSPAQEIVSRPRIVKRDDIKRVSIRRGKPQLRELTVPYCPDDLCMDPSSSSTSETEQPESEPEPRRSTIRLVTQT